MRCSVTVEIHDFKYPQTLLTPHPLSKFVCNVLYVSHVSYARSAKDWLGILPKLVNFVSVGNLFLSVHIPK